MGMYDKTLARRILEALEEASPSSLDLGPLQATLPEYKDLSSQQWVLAVQALRFEGKLKGKFLPDKGPFVAAARLYITEVGRLQLKEPAGSITTEFTDTVRDNLRAPAIDTAVSIEAVTVASDFPATGPLLSEVTKRRLELQWESVRDQQNLADEELADYDKERQRLFRMPANPPSHVRPLRPHWAARSVGLTQSVMAAKARFRGIDREYWSLWCSSGFGYEVYRDWLDSATRQVLNELSKIWKSRSEMTDRWFDSRCEPAIEKALADVVKQRIAQARDVETKRLERPSSKARTGTGNPVADEILARANDPESMRRLIESGDDSLSPPAQRAIQLARTRMKAESPGRGAGPGEEIHATLRTDVSDTERSSDMVVFGSSRLVTIVRAAGTPEELRWDTHMGGDFARSALFQTVDRVVTGDEIYTDLFDEPRVVARVDPVLTSGQVAYWKATIVPRSEWSRRWLVGPNRTLPSKESQTEPTDGETRGRKGDLTLLKGTGGALKDSVSYDHARLYLGVSRRQVERLVSEKKGLTVTGGGHNKQVTVSSLLAYLPAKKAT